MKFKKVLPLLSLEDFLEKVKGVKSFKSSHGNRYEVDGIIDGVMFFRRMSVGGSDWDINLHHLHRAYVELESFNTLDFKPYVPKRHSPGRGLLLHLKMIAWNYQLNKL